LKTLAVSSSKSNIPYCDYDPDEDRFSHEGEEHAEATMIKGSRDAFFLCNYCSQLPKFKRLKIRRLLK
jgi:hypothetical protein